MDNCLFDARSLHRVCVYLYLKQLKAYVQRLSMPQLVNYYTETFAKHSILAKVKKGEDFDRRNTRSILRIKI